MSQQRLCEMRIMNARVFDARFSKGYVSKNEYETSLSVLQSTNEKELNCYD
jgi:hypothetical protein